MRARPIPMLLTFAVSLAVLPGSNPRASDEPRMEIGVIGGAELSDHDVAGEPQDQLGRWGWALGGRFGHGIGDSTMWFFDATTSKTGTNLAPGDVEMNVLRTGFEVFLTPGARRWFVQGAGGWADVDFEGNQDFDRPMVSFGIGRRIRIANDGFFRWEIRADRLLGNDGIGGQDVMNGQFLFGWSLGLGGPPPDTDGDGVSDRDDQCPGTPLGARVNDVGCPLDSDGDRVYDGLDNCPETPAGATVDAAGCPKDTDKDGVPDGLDRCPDTPAGAIVDLKGCPVDSDGDGVPDGIDRCPDTQRGTAVDARGCPLDSDGDGVPDGTDRCPDTPRGTKVDATGCPEAPKPAPIFPGESKKLVLEGVNFAYDKAVLTQDSLAVLDRVAASLGDWPDVKVEVGGHTDSKGSETYNRSLSARRAKAVRDYLVEHGVDPSRLTVKGYGESEPVADNATEEGRAQNRRVELTKKD